MGNKALKTIISNRVTTIACSAFAKRVNADTHFKLFLTHFVVLYFLVG
jgi:hypothetical protein